MHQRCQWHLRGGKGCFGGLQGLQRGFLLHLLTLMLWVLARFDRSPCLRDAGVQQGPEGLGAALAINPPGRLAAGRWRAVMLSLEGAAAAWMLYSHRAAEGRPPPQVSPAARSAPARQRSPLSAARERDRSDAAAALQSEAPGLGGEKIRRQGDFRVPAGTRLVLAKNCLHAVCACWE